eukprot:TRINITY_DN122255_c0_g1_i1.p1 TRINITY_DN122255_c0_g1~~TRINITY_DN122255_c0_g1_i1.p1  ORF type:complete len:487 (-),score=72.23 TRINITY_DN122255_c0_g1_i1:897-2357(-)
MNPAEDMSAETSQVSPNRKVRCKNQRHEPGGGGINVARVLVRLGGDALALFPAGGSSGNRLPGMLENEGVAHRMNPVGNWTRNNLKVYESNGENEYFFIMPGPELEEHEWQSCLEEVAKVQGEADFVVASGSLPPGVPSDFYARLARQLADDGVKMILDTSGEALREGASEGIYLIKPNRRELGQLVGEDITDEAHEEDVAQGLVKKGLCEALVLSLSAGGAKLFTDGNCRHFRAPTVEIKSTTGAGDSMLAGIALRLAEGDPLEKAVRYGVAAGAAAVTTPGSGLCKAEMVDKLFEKVSSQVISPVSSGPMQTTTAPQTDRSVKRGSGMKVEVDRGRCMNTGLCMLMAPQLFKQAPRGRKSTPIRREVPRELEELCAEMAKSCPTKAIRTYGDQKFAQGQRKCLTGAKPCLNCPTWKCRAAICRLPACTRPQTSWRLTPGVNQGASRARSWPGSLGAAAWRRPSGMASTCWSAWTTAAGSPFILE